MKARSKLFDEPPANRAYGYPCAAHGCPLRATIFDSVIGPPLHGRCRYHDAASPHFWPQLTRILQSSPFDAPAMRDAIEAAGFRWLEDAPQLPPARRYSLREAKAIARAWLSRPVVGDTDPLDWAKSLREREKRGENLEACQRKAWRIALVNSIPDESEREARLEREGMQAESSAYERTHAGNASL